MLALCARDGCRDGQARVSRPRASTSMQAGGGRDLLAEEAAAFFCIFSEDDDDMVVNTEFRRTALHGGDAAAGPPLAGYVCCHEFPDQALEVLNTFVHFGAPCAGVAEPGQLRRRMRSCPTSLAGDPGEAADLTNVLGVAEEWPQLVLEDGDSDWTRDGEGVRLEPLVLESPIADGVSPVRMPLVDRTRASDGQFEAFPAWQQSGADVPSQDPCVIVSRWWFEQPEASFQAMAHVAWMSGGDWSCQAFVAFQPADVPSQLALPPLLPPRPLPFAAGILVDGSCSMVHAVWDFDISHRELLDMGGPLSEWPPVVQVESSVEGVVVKAVAGEAAVPCMEVLLDDGLVMSNGEAAVPSLEVSLDDGLVMSNAHFLDLGDNGAVAINPGEYEVDELQKEPARRVRKYVRNWKRFYDCLFLVNSWERFDVAQAAVEAGQSL